MSLVLHTKCLLPTTPHYNTPSNKAKTQATQCNVARFLSHTTQSSHNSSSDKKTFSHSPATFCQLARCAICGAPNVLLLLLFATSADSCDIIFFCVFLFLLPRLQLCCYTLVILLVVDIFSAWHIAVLVLCACSALPPTPFKPEIKRKPLISTDCVRVVLWLLDFFSVCFRSSCLVYDT